MSRGARGAALVAAVLILLALSSCSSSSQTLLGSFDGPSVHVDTSFPPDPAPAVVRGPGHGFLTSSLHCSRVNMAKVDRTPMALVVMSPAEAASKHGPIDSCEYEPVHRLATQPDYYYAYSPGEPNPSERISDGSLTAAKAQFLQQVAVSRRSRPRGPGFVTFKVAGFGKGGFGYCFNTESVIRPENELSGTTCRIYTTAPAGQAGDVDTTGLIGEPVGSVLARLVKFADLAIAAT